MSNFLKPINNLPVAESISKGDKILISSGGVVKQIDASLVGGGGSGGTVVYAQIMDESFGVVTAYKDAEHTQMLTYEEGKKAFSGIAIVNIDFAGHKFNLIPAATFADEETKTFIAISFAKYVMIEDTSPIRVVFSDSVIDD